MRKFRLLLFPITISWFAGVLWWISHRDGCGCGNTAATGSQTAAAASIISPGPEKAEATPFKADPAPAVTPASLDPILLQPLSIPFVKNRQGSGTSQEIGPYADALKAALLSDPNATITITGHTDADGDADLNRRLSLERAEAVKAELIDLGIPEARMSTLGMGADQPVADNLTSKGKAKNRRVDIMILPARVTEPPTNTLP